MGQLIQLGDRRGMGQVQEFPLNLLRRKDLKMILPEIKTPDFLEQEAIPGIKNLHVVYAGAGLLALLAFARATRRS